jgi:TRAP-type mannitol/chloroaromatic compound transport system permease small subunit
MGVQLADHNRPVISGNFWPLVTRMFGWANLGVLLVFIVNVFLVNSAGFPGAARFQADAGIIAWLQFLLYPLAIALACYHVYSSRETPLRVDADRITAINNFIIRAAFWAVLIVGLVDMLISFLRIEGFIDIIAGEQLTRDLGRAQFRGFYVHVPLILLSIAIAAFTRTLGFIWLALAIVVAELLIVFSRFVFSYEQAFMADLVRFWYGALFLFASAYTLVEEGHVRVDVFYASFQVSTKGMINAIGTLTMGIVLCWTILLIGMEKPTSIINAPVFNFEVTQSTFGMYVKYMMAGFLGIFAISMMVQFVSYLMSAVADWRGDPGHVEHDPATVT